MKHFTLLLMAFATVCTSAFAQPRSKNVYTSSTTLNVEALQNQAQPTVLNRTLFAGYNTICLPVSLNAAQLQAAAKDVQVERLATIRQEGSTLNMYFLDCTSEGIEAGVPYLIFSPTVQTLRANTSDASGFSTEIKSVSKSDGQGNTVTFSSSWETLKVEGRYGIPAQQDTYILESVLIRTEGDKAFLPTRCGFTWNEQANDAEALEIKHVTSLEDIETSIEKLQATGATVDVYNAQGTLVLSQTNINGSGDVDVADVITTVNYAAGQQPKPFIFEAADMNTDLSIDILDVIGIIKKIMNPSAGTQAFEEATATYTIENGILYVESPVALAGVQVQLALDGRGNKEDVRVAEDLNGFEHTSAWLSDNDYLFLAYNMNGKTLPAGKHALLHIGNGLIAQMRLADNAGHNVEAIGDDATRINRMAGDVMTVPGIYDLQGRKITGNSQWQGQLPKGVYIINGKKVVR